MFALCRICSDNFNILHGRVFMLSILHNVDIMALAEMYINVHVAKGCQNFIHVGAEFLL